MTHVQGPDRLHIFFAERLVARVNSFMSTISRLRILVLTFGFALVFSSSLASGDAPNFEYRDGLRVEQGDHGLRLSMISRYRFEYWDAPQSDGSNDIHGIRTRVGLRYSWRDAVSLFAQMQDTRVLGLDDPPDSGGGAAGLYQSNAPPGSSSTESIRLRQGYLDVRLAKGSFLRAGRQDINMGTMIRYDDPAWSWLKTKRLSQRLVGTVGWANGERSFDGVSGAGDLDDFFIHAFAAQPTKGVFSSHCVPPVMTRRS